MKRKLGILIALVMAISLCLSPAMVSAVGYYDTTLRLENKDSDWNEILRDGIKGVLRFNSSGYEFEYQFFAKGLEASTEYSLIYYADPWAGDNPGAVIAEFVSNGAGRIPKWQIGSVELGMSLPCESDANYLEGAKIWLVPSSFLTDGALPLDTWDREAMLFERNLITYTDTGTTPVVEPETDWECIYLEIQQTQLQVFMPWGFGDVHYSNSTLSELFVVGTDGAYNGQQYVVVIPAGTAVVDGNGLRPASLRIYIVEDVPVIVPSVTFSQPCTLYTVDGRLYKTYMGEWVGGTLIEVGTFTEG